MEKEYAKKVLFNAMYIGEELLKCGAEIGRVEDTISRICIAYGAKRVDVFCITSSIVTSMYGDGFDVETQTRRVRGTKIDMTKLDSLNKLSRKICKTTPSPETVKEDIEKINEAPWRSVYTCMAIYAVISGTFSLFFGGNFKDMICAAVIGVMLKIIELPMRNRMVNSFVTAMICSVTGGFLSNITVSMGLGTNADLISIGNIMLLIPGMAFVNSLRDLFSGDTVSGAVRCLESLTLAIVIATGFTLANLI